MQNWNNLNKIEQNKRANLQIALEEDLLDYSVDKYWRAIAHDPISGAAEQDLIKDFINQSTKAFKMAQDEIAKDYKMAAWAKAFLMLDPTIVAAVVITQTVEDLVDSRDLRKRIYANGVDNAYSVAYRIGREIKNICAFKIAQDKDEERFKYVSRYVKEWTPAKAKAFYKKADTIPKWDKRQTLYLGTCLLNVAKATGVVTVETKKYKQGDSVRSYNMVTMDPDIMLELIRRHDQYQFLKLIYRPMLVPPVPHTLESAGGCLVMERRKSTVGGISKISEEHIESLNVLQSTEWGINERVLEVMQTLYIQNEGLCNMPSYDFDQFTFTRPYPEKGTSDEKVAWKRDKEEQYSKWYKEVQKRAQMEIRLTLAKKFVKTKFFYHAYTCDFRGRGYTTTEMLSPQSGDFDRGLLKFATPCKVTREGMYWLMVHVANCCDGMDYDGDGASDKDTFDDRVSWVKRNINYLRKISEDPYANNEWMDNKTTKKNPSFQRLGAIVDFVNALDTGYSSCPVQLDGSCNGSQHWSAIMLDQEIAELVNVCPTDKPGDLYQYVADIATDICKASDEKWPQVFYEHWEHKIPRKVLKRSTMCDAYGITDHGIRRYVREEGHISWVGQRGTEVVQAVNELSTIIRLSLDGAMESSNAGKVYLQDLTEIAAGHGKFVSWTTPNGFRVINRYTEAKEDIRQSQFYRNRRLKMTSVKDTKAINVAFAVQAIPPNFIHSIDAAHMMMTIAGMWQNGVTHFSMIHDSFGCPCNDVPVMRKVINEKFYEIHKDNQLERFKQDVEDAVGPIARALPERGKLDVGGVLFSEYLFG